MPDVLRRTMDSGTRRYRSFAAFMRQQWQTYQGAHPVLGSPKAARRLNLRKPPDIESIIRDPEQFISELLRLDYFRYTTDAARDRILNEFRQRAKESRNQQRLCGRSRRICP